MRAALSHHYGVVGHVTIRLSIDYFLYTSSVDIKPVSCMPAEY